ncbi:YheU family protein [Desulfuromonas sp. TF]|uniref:YheU family protein n=1 Tax=Desulfuromonas sp. TF TaxID=1232410 RepID=UPI0004162808|nr:YheU family protein [Desulfuromonas sp. TF]
MSREKSAGNNEEGIEVPYEQIHPDTLRNLIQEFVTRDGADWADAGCALEDKVEQVLRQLRDKKVKVVFDLTSQTANIVASR